MAELPENLFLNPIWHALQTNQRHLGIVAADAARYFSEVAPFAAVRTPEPSSLRQLAKLMAPQETVWIVGEEYPPIHDLAFVDSLECFQMVLDEALAIPDHLSPEILALDATDAPEMVALTDLAFPGYFRRETFRMGSYYGVRHNGELIAMGGERLKLGRYSEISGVCTHPSYRGKGHAAAIIWKIVSDHRSDGCISWLNVGARNQP